MRTPSAIDPATHLLGGIHAPFEVRPSPLAGLGLFATRTVAAHSFVTVYDGERIGWAEAHRRPASHLRGVAFGHEAIDGLRVPLAGRGAGSFCNHAAGPRANATFWPRDGNVWIKARGGAIPEGAEVLVDYGRGYWTRRAHRGESPPRG